MINPIDATVINGVIHPDKPVQLPDRSRVRLTIEPIEAWSSETARAAWARIEARLQERPIHGGGVRYTREELHERR